METDMKGTRSAIYLLAFTCLAALLSFAQVQNMEHVVAGVVTGIDKDAKTITVKSADGAEHVFKYGDQTLVRGYHEASKGVKKGAVDTYFAGKEGTSVTVHYSEKGSDKVASSVDDLGKDTVKTSEGTITKVDKKAHKITIKTEDGAETTYDFGKDAAGESQHGVVKGWDYTASKAKEGDKVAVQYTDEAGKKVVHFFKSF
jgi:NADH dehydrogenase FAD-containing subunit